MGDLAREPGFFSFGSVDGDVDDAGKAEPVGEGEGLVEGVDRSGGHPGRQQDGGPVVCARGAEPLGQDVPEFDTVSDPVGVGAEAVVESETGIPDDLGERRELPVVAHREGDRPIRGRQGLVRGDARVRVAHAAGNHTGYGVGRGLVDHGRQQRAEQIHLHELPFTGGVPVP